MPPPGAVPPHMAQLSSVASQLAGMRQGQAGAQARLEGVAAGGEPEFLLGQLLLRSDAIAAHPAFGGLAEQAAAAMGGPAVEAGSG